MTEVVIAHRSIRDLWSSLTFSEDSDDVLVYQNGETYSMTRESAELTVQYCEQSTDYIVERITGAYIGG